MLTQHGDVMSITITARLSPHTRQPASHTAPARSSYATRTRLHTPTADKRRTLAWHIVRKPRGLIAGAIQNGHLHVQMTLGYSGAYDSGFPDEHAFEQWLWRVNQLAEDHQRLQSGEHVSGPAADAYRQRISAAHDKFAGRVLRNTQPARDMLANPLLQIFPGRAMTCVFDQAKALCQVRRAQGDPRVTPDQDDCRPNCRNIAYTDCDMDQLRVEVAGIRAIVDDSLAPSPRHQRACAESERLQRIIDNHDRHVQAP
jgi:hypothetical protein